MRVFVTGATGFIGSAVVQDLLGAGHQVLGLARSDAAADRLDRLGAEAHRGDLEDLESLATGAGACDGVIHTAFVHDFANLVAIGAIDRRAVEAIGAALAGSGKPFAMASGIALLTPGRVATEGDDPDPDAAAAYRMGSEEVMAALASRGVRSSIVRLPPSVHGDGDGGFVPALIGVARQTGVSGHVGDGLNRWPAVHRLDAARVFRRALEAAPAGARLHAVADEGVRVRDIAEVIGRRLGLAVEPREPAHFGWLGGFLAVDCPASSARTQAQLGWSPSHPSLLEDLDREAYFVA